MANLRITGAEQLREVGTELKVAPRAMRSRLRRNLVVATEPITGEAKSNFESTYGNLGADLADATKLRLATAGRMVGVSVGVYGSRMPEDKQSLPPLVEGVKDWRHPLWGNKGFWYGQAPHQELTPAVRRHLPGVEIAVVEAIDETADALAYGRA